MVDTVFKAIQTFESRIDLPRGFYLGLLKESDWGFVIKLHSLFEGASTHILNLRLGSGRIESALSHLDFGHSKYGKVTLLQDLGILASRETKFLRFLSELRNDLVHRVQSVAFSFEKHVQAFDSNQKRSFCDRVGYNTNDPIEIAGASVPRNKFICENPKLSVWLTASDVLACILVEEQFVDVEQKRKEIELRELAFAEKIIDMNSLILRPVEDSE